MMEIKTFKVIAHDSLDGITRGDMTILDTRGAEQKMQWLFTSITNDYNGYTMLDVDLFGPDGEDINYNDMALPEDADDDEVGFVVTEHDPAKRMHVPAEGHTLFLSEQDYENLADMVVEKVSKLLGDARDAAQIAFEGVLLGK